MNDEQGTEGIAAEVDQSEDRLASAIEALAYKKSRIKGDVREAAAERKNDVLGQVAEKKDDVVGKIKEKVAGAGDALVSKAKDTVGSKLSGGGGSAEEPPPPQSPDEGAGVAAIDVILVDEHGRPAAAPR